MKQCCHCKQIKPLTEYSKNKNKKDGLCIHCKSCMKYFSKQNYNNNKEKYKQKRIKNKQQKSEYDKQYRQDTKQHQKERNVIWRQSKKTGGVYYLLHHPTGSIYIGQTSSFFLRWRDHKKRIKNNNHENDYINQLSPEGWEMIPILLSDDKDERLYYEKELINNTNCINHLYS